MICEYCRTIHSFDKRYPRREATRDLNSDYPRCDWHWRFVCSICGRPRHFNGITWCEQTRRFICLSCAKSHRIVRRKFWNWKLYYTLECDVCGKYHPALDYLEFSAKHPWQLDANMKKNREGLDSEATLQIPEAVYVPLKKGVVNEKQIARAWDNLADKWSCGYTEYGDMNRQFIIDPTLFRLIGSVRGLHILDAGCGSGYLSRLLAKKGAKMAGVDISKRSIGIAKQKEKEAPLGIAYHVGTLSRLDMFQDGAFDMIVSNLALMDVLELEKAVRELHRVLKSEGKLFFSIMHPCFSSAPVHGWVRKPQDSQRKEDWIYWKVDQYFSRSVQIWQYRDWPSTYSFHLPLSDYIKTLLRNGFAVVNFEEPIPTEKAMREHYRELGNECERIPWFLIIGARKA